MSPRREPARPITKITLKITLEGDDEGPSTLRAASEAMKGSSLSRDGRAIVSQTSDPAEAIEEVKRLREAFKGTRDTPKDFK
jgi:hypothetical protein